MVKKKVKEERFTQYRIKIEKVVQWILEKKGERRKDIMWIASINPRHGIYKTSFNESTKAKLWKHLKEEIKL